MTFTIVAVIAGLALLVYLVWLRAIERHPPLPPMSPTHERRADQALFLRLLENLNTLDERYEKFTYRVLRSVAIVGVACAVALAFEGKLLDDSRDLAAQQRSGRAVAIDALCGAVSGVVDAGRATITLQTTLPPRFERALVRLGYPPAKVRRRQAHVAARAYGEAIAKAVEDATGREHKDLTRKDGSLDCSRLKRAAGAVSVR